jgi:hypothetical protein
MNKELHEKFKAETGSEMEYELFANIFKTNNEVIVDSVTSRKEGYSFPFNIGSIQLMVFVIPAKKDTPDIDHLYKTSYYDENIGKIFFTAVNTKYPRKHIGNYRFTAHRLFKNKASKAFSENIDIFETFRIKPWDEQKKLRNDYLKRTYKSGKAPLASDPNGFKVNE